MHNCSETRERLIEMVIDGVDCAAELDGCAECRTEFGALNATLRVTRRLGETTPDEDYWPGYHARLRQKLSAPEGISHAKEQRRKQDAGDDRASALRLFFAPLRLCVRVPVPLLAMTILGFAALTVFAVRTTKPEVVQNPVIVHVPVEVPVVQEKIVTRVVYRDRVQWKTSRHTVDTRAESTFARSRKPATEEIPATLTGFKPTEEIKLTVLKGGAPK